MGSQAYVYEGPALRYPPKAVVCLKELSKDCAAEAARRVGHEIIWLPPKGDLKFLALLAYPVLASQEMASEDMIVSVSSGPTYPAEGQVIARIHHGPDEAVVRRDDPFGADGWTVAWVRGGTEFQIGVISEWMKKVTLDQVKELFMRVTYVAGPP